MASFLRPRRGKKATAQAQLTASNPLKRGEVFFEVPDTGVGTGTGKIKMGDGVKAYADLPYFLQQPTVDYTNAVVSWTDTSAADSDPYTTNATYAGNIVPSASLKTIFTNLKKLLLNYNSQLTSLNNDLEIFLNLTLEETTPLAVCKHIRENVDVSKLLIKGCHFNAIVNNADFFSGHIYSDGDIMYWGTIQQRTDSIDNCQLYKYFSSGGADTVIPFNNIKICTQATATAEQITKGYTAWVNGELITGTRPAPVITLSGIVNTSKGWDTTSWSGTVTFSSPFDSVPNVTLALASALDGTRDVRAWVSVSLVSKSKDIFVWQVYANYDRPISVSFNWVASIQ